MIPKGEYVLSRVKALAVNKAKENERIKPLTLINLIEQWEFDYEMDKEYFPEQLYSYIGKKHGEKIRNSIKGD